MPSSTFITEEIFHVVPIEVFYIRNIYVEEILEGLREKNIINKPFPSAAIYFD